MHLIDKCGNFILASVCEYWSLFKWQVWTPCYLMDWLIYASHSTTFLVALLHNDWLKAHNYWWRQKTHIQSLWTYIIILISAFIIESLLQSPNIKNDTFVFCVAWTLQLVFLLYPTKNICPSLFLAFPSTKLLALDMLYPFSFWLLLVLPPGSYIS